MPAGDYSDSFKAESLAALQANGGNILRTSREMNVPESTLRSWKNGSGTRALTADLRDQKRTELSGKLDDLAVKLVDGMTDEKITASNVRDLMIALGICVDKARLIQGETTSITESRRFNEVHSRLEAKLVGEVRREDNLDD